MLTLGAEQGSAQNILIQVVSTALYAALRLMQPEMLSQWVATHPLLFLRIRGLLHLGLALDILTQLRRLQLLAEA
jgi:hypothetical protein